MKKNFKNALEHVLVHEGGWADHPRDPGAVILARTRASERCATSRTTSWVKYTAPDTGTNVGAASCHPGSTMPCLTRPLIRARDAASNGCRPPSVPNRTETSGPGPSLK